MQQGINFIDIAILAIVVSSLVFGIIKGMVHAVFSVASYGVAFYGSSNLAQSVAPFIDQVVKNRYASTLMSYIVLFLGIFVAMKWINIMAVKFIKFIGFTAFDKAMGGIIGILKGIFIASIIIIMFEMFSPTTLTPYVKKSKSAQFIAPIVSTIKKTLPKYIKNIDANTIAVIIQEFT